MKTNKCLLVSFVAALLSASCADGVRPGVNMTPIEQGDDETFVTNTEADAGPQPETSPTAMSGTDMPETELPATEPTVTAEPEPGTEVEPDAATAVTDETTATEPEPEATEVTVTEEPEPAPQPEPEPVTAEPEPATAEPETTVVEPEPATSEPEPDPSGPFCGNGITEPGEPCDDGNDLNGDGCETDCSESPAVCVPTPKPPVTGTLRSLNCTNWAFEAYGEQYAFVEKGVCVDEDNCYFPVGGSQTVGVGHWNGISLVPESMPVNDPSRYHVYSVSGVTGDLWAVGEQGAPGQPLILRKVGSADWEVVTSPNGCFGATAVWSNGTTVLASLVCTGGSVVYKWDGAAFVATNGTVASGGIDDMWGSSSSDVYAVGFSGSNGVALRWDGCGWENDGAIPGDVTNLNGVSGFGGRIFLVGNTGAQTGVRLSTGDVNPWDRYDSPVGWGDTAILALGAGASISVGWDYQLQGGYAFLAEMSAGTWESGQSLPPPGTQASEILANGSNGKVIVLTRTGVWNGTCQVE
ncbi:MAG: hypothetical protein RL141_601 [Candidatus Parcubacteria bacterium]